MRKGNGKKKGTGHGPPGLRRRAKKTQKKIKNQKRTFRQDGDSQKKKKSPAAKTGGKKRKKKEERANCKKKKPLDYQGGGRFARHNQKKPGKGRPYCHKKGKKSRTAGKKIAHAPQRKKRWKKSRWQLLTKKQERGKGFLSSKAKKEEGGDTSRKKKGRSTKERTKKRRIKGVASGRAEKERRF